jgi:hypothetical protein
VAGHTTATLQSKRCTADHSSYGRVVHSTYPFRHPWTVAIGCEIRYKSAHNVWRFPTPDSLVVVQRIHATMSFCVVIVFLFALLPLVLLWVLHHLCLLEAADRFGAHLLLADGGDAVLFNIAVATLRGSIRIRLSQEPDPLISLTREEYESASASHPPGPLPQDWEAVTDAALSATRQLIRHFKHTRGPDDETRLYIFIQSVILSTFLRLFFHLQTTPTNIEDVLWIAGETWRAGDSRKDTMPSLELHRLVKPSPNPSGVFALLSTTERLILATICTLEGRGENIPFLRRASALLRNPISPEPDVTRLVEKVKRTNPPIQLIHGRLSMGSLPFHGSHSMDIHIPVDVLPSSACIFDQDGSCISWIHKALPSQLACGGENWLTHATAIILSAIVTEIRQANLTIDADGYDPEAWEDWVLRRLRVG